MPKHRRFSLLFLAWLAFISISSLVSFESGREDFLFTLPHADKLVHFCFYFGFVVLGILALKEIWPNTTIKKGICFCIGLAIIYGILMELLQLLMPHRSPDVYDALANGVGALMGGLLIITYRSRIAWLN